VFAAAFNGKGAARPRRRLGAVEQAARPRG
jgi:hypothetical protein